MGKQETGRRNPIAHITLFFVVLLFIFEAAVIVGIFELKAQTVAKYAPWAYEPYLRLIGEHPDSTPRWVMVEEAEEEPAEEIAIENMTGLEPSAIPVLIETNEAVLATNLILEASVPLEVELEPLPVIMPINAPSEEVEEAEPVG